MIDPDTGAAIVEVEQKNDEQVGSLLLTTLFFLADVLSAMYLAAVKWRRAKKSSIAVGIV